MQQATTLLRDTEATIPQLEFQRRQNADSLCVLLGIPAGVVADADGLMGIDGELRLAFGQASPGRLPEAKRKLPSPDTAGGTRDG